jgi:DNA-binding winged helix-turn-helix (wHTH) protein
LLLQGGAPLPIGSRALDVLIALVEHAGSIMSKEQLLASAWPNISVHEANLRVHIGGIRKLLGDGREDHRYIVNEAGRGYRFVAPVVVSEEPTPSDSEPSPNEASHPAAESMRANLTPIIGRSKIIDALIEQLPKKRRLRWVWPSGLAVLKDAPPVLSIWRRLWIRRSYTAS